MRHELGQPSRRSFLLAGALLAANNARASVPTPSDCSPCDRTIACFEPYDFVDSKGQSHRVYVAGSGPPVLVLHELPGLTPADISFAKRLVSEGYTVLLPLLFGKPGDARTFHNLIHECGRSKFDCYGSDRTPEPVQWIKEFCGHVAQRWPSQRGMGVIGMCLTGAFPLALLELKNVAAPVLCQPTSPTGLLYFLRLEKNSPKIGIATTDLDHARDDSQVSILAIRYASDWRCPNGRFNALSERFPHRFFRLDLAGSHKHSSLGGNFSCLAYQEVRAFLRQRLVDPNEKFPLRSRCHAIDPTPIRDTGCEASKVCSA